MDASSHSAPASASGAPAASWLRGFHPGWFGAVMGTAVVGIIAYQNPGNLAGLRDAGRALGVAMVGLGAVLAVALGAPYIARWIRHPGAAMADLRSPFAGALYGTFPGGILVLAVGIGTVAPSLGAADIVTGIVAVLAAIGVVLAFGISVAFAYLLFVEHEVGPQTANGAWFIPPVVNIIVPLALLPLVPHAAAGDATTLIAAGYAFFGMGLLLFLLVASLLYDRLVFHPLPAAPLAPSLWIGLGPVGVGSLVLLRLAQAGAPLWGAGAAAVGTASTLAATAIWGFGLWWLAAAALLLGGYLRRGRLPFGIGWWAFTFPLGAYTASTVALARAWESGPLETLAALLFALLVAFWLAVTVGTLRAVRSGEAWRR
jgi:C4-dicarboxylate transporter/malic acid transport protein